MLNSITINNFKAIQSEKGLTLNNLASVNYLVGKNGCGKSSVLEMLIACYNGSPSKDFASNIKNSLKNRSIKKQYKMSSLEIKLTNSVLNKFNLIIAEEDNFIYSDSEIYLIENGFKDDDHADGRCYLVDNDTVDFALKSVNIFSKNRVFSRLAKTSTYKENKEKLLSVIQKFADFDTKKSKLIKGERVHIVKKYLSTGESALTNFIYELFVSICEIVHFPERFESEGSDKSKKKFIKSKIKPLSYVLVHDEPETSLHPTFQKIVPLILEEFIKIFSLPIQFIIATHSPFIISEASKYKENQKVYLIEDGQTRGLEENSLGQGQDGFVGGECLLAVNQMLGVSMSDFVPTHLYLCERSLSIFIKSFCVAQKTKIQPVFLCEKGDSAVLTKGQIWKHLLTFYNQANKDGAFKVNLKIIIDENSEIKQQVQDFKFPEDLIQLQTTEQELLYQESIYKNSQIIEKDWDRVVHPSIVEFYETKIDQDLLAKGKEKQKKQAIGKLKCEFAKYVGEHITKEQFKTFCPELHSLIFN